MAKKKPTAFVAVQESKPMAIESNARHLVLRLLVNGKARIEGQELCFNSMRYHARADEQDWAGILNVIGWNKVHAALESGATHAE